MPIDVDLTIVGAGPSGCAAAVMAESLGLSSCLLEATATVGGVLMHVPTLANVIGFADGPSLVGAMEASLSRLNRCRVVVGCAATALDARESSVVVRWDGGKVESTWAIVATGTVEKQLEDAAWVGGSYSGQPSSLWQLDRVKVAGRRVVVVGADRVIGSILRNWPELEDRITVVAGGDDAYKLAELDHYPALRILQVDRLTVQDTACVIRAEAQLTNGRTVAIDVDRDCLFVNLGKVARVLAGTPVLFGPSGYPETVLSDRVLLAGDVRRHRGQRIATAMGSGADAALDLYYRSIGLEPRKS